MSANVTLTIRIYRNERLVRTESLSQTLVKIGTRKASHLRLDDKKVSAWHAVIETVDADNVYIIDLGSAAGTIVNGTKVSKTRLKSGDKILLGETYLTIQISTEGA